MFITTKEIKQIFDNIIKSIDESLNDEKIIEITDDYYWFIRNDKKKYNPIKYKKVKNRDLSLGQLNFDWDNLKKYLDNDIFVIISDLIILSSILNWVGENFLIPKTKLIKNDDNWVLIINTNDLKDIFNKLINQLKDQLYRDKIESININDDHHWIIKNKIIYNSLVDLKDDDFTICSLHNDCQTLLYKLQNKLKFNSLDFLQLSHILEWIGIKYHNGA